MDQRRSALALANQRRSIGNPSAQWPSRAGRSNRARPGKLPSRRPLGMLGCSPRLPLFSQSLVGRNLRRRGRSQQHSPGRFGPYEHGCSDATSRPRLSGYDPCISRNGLLPQPHKSADASPPFWNESSPKTTRGLLGLVRKQIRQARQQGIEWQSTFDSLRPLVAQIWQSLPEEEKRRFLRHVRPYWEVHRHRAAPEVAKSAADQISSGRLRVRPGRITDYAEDKNGVTVTYRDRKSGKATSLKIDRVINCTGPQSDYRHLENPLMSALLAEGWARPDPLFLGLDVSLDGALVGRDGTIPQSLYVIGPARKGSLWESTAVPELREQIQQLVRHLVNQAGQATDTERVDNDSLRSETPSDKLVSRV